MKVIFSGVEKDDKGYTQTVHLGILEASVMLRSPKSIDEPLVEVKVLSKSDTAIIKKIFEANLMDHRSGQGRRGK
jgi:hypothetical protein